MALRGLAYQTLGRALRQHGQHDKSISAYRKAIQLQPKDATARIGLGTSLLERGKHQEAVNAFREAIRLQAANALAHNWLGVAPGASAEAG